MLCKNYQNIHVCPVFCCFVFRKFDSFSRICSVSLDSFETKQIRIYFQFRAPSLSFSLSLSSKHHPLQHEYSKNIKTQSAKIHNKCRKLVKIKIRGNEIPCVFPHVQSNSIVLTLGVFFFIFFLSKDRRQHIINESDASGRKYGMRKTQSDVSRE